MTVKTLMTAEEFEAIAHELGSCELVGGEVVQLSPAGYRHSKLTAKFVTLLSIWCEQADRGEILAGEPGFVVETDPDTVRGADVAYISAERLTAAQGRRGFMRIAPNLVVEIVGQGQGWQVMLDKVAEYLQFGVERVWIVDPDSQTLHVFRADASPIILTLQDTITDEPVLPGFSCQVSQFFK